MTWRAAEQIADALLYEGYLLYPYRRSALKNRYRWQFGIVSPPRRTGAEDGGATFMRTECLIESATRPVLDLKVRFLQVEARTVEQPVRAPEQWQAVDRLVVDGRPLLSWDEAHPRELALSGILMGEPFAERVHHFSVNGRRAVEIVRNDAGDVVARVVRERWPISCAIHVALELDGELRKLSVRIENVTDWESGADADRPAVLRRSLVGAHTLLAVTDGAFVSLIDPPPHATSSASRCRNERTWPVLVGQPPERNLILSAPIVLYDYPSVAPESPGDLFDGTEIDEMLTLRLMTLTDAERREALATDPRAREIIERAATLPPRALERLHGTVRSSAHSTAENPVASSWEAFLNPPGAATDETLEIGGKRLTKGTRVRLRLPSGRRADAMDMFLDGQTATVAAVYRDLEDQAHIAVTADAARANDIHAANGRYFYFRPDEVEVLDSGDEQASSDITAHTRRVLVAGIGNMFLGDDGFGCAVIQRLGSRALPTWVKVEDFGIRGIHLAYELLGATPSYDVTIVVDAVSRGGAPGTLYVLEPDVEAVPAQPPDAHQLSVEAVLGFLKHIGGKPGRVLLVGCEAASVTPEIGLSEPVSRAVDEAAELVVSLLTAEQR